jgi:hypothetical protein
MRSTCPVINQGAGSDALSTPLTTISSSMSHLGRSFPHRPSPSRRVYLEGSERFLLRAKYLDNIFYISTDEHFDISDPSQGGYIAKLMSVPLSHPSSSPLILTLLDRPKTHLLMFSSRQPVAIVITNWGATSAVLTPHREKSSPRSLMSLSSPLPLLPPPSTL